MHEHLTVQGQVLGLAAFAAFCGACVWGGDALARIRARQAPQVCECCGEPLPWCECLGPQRDGDPFLDTVTAWRDEL